VCVLRIEKAAPLLTICQLCFFLVSRRRRRRDTLEMFPSLLNFPASCLLLCFEFKWPAWKVRIEETEGIEID
jgi:hypothetical protein